MRFILATVISAAGCALAQPCTPPQLLSPPAGTVGSDARPLIAVKPAAAPTTTLFAEVRVPEKGILRRFEARMPSNALRLPLDEPLYRANVQLRLTATCAGDEKAVTAARFYVDTGLACAPPIGAAVSGDRVTWAHATGASATEIAFFDAGDARQLRRETVAASAPASVSRRPGEPVAALRSRCGNAYSAPAFVYGD